MLSLVFLCANVKVHVLEGIHVLANPGPQAAALGSELQTRRGARLGGRRHAERFRIVPEADTHALGVPHTQAAHFYQAHERGELFAAFQDIGAVLQQDRELAAADEHLPAQAGVYGIRLGFQGQYAGPLADVFVNFVGLGGQVHFQMRELCPQGVHLHVQVRDGEVRVDIGCAYMHHVQL